MPSGLHRYSLVFQGIPHIEHATNPGHPGFPSFAARPADFDAARKKLEKEIEALRIVLPIVADANQNALETDPSKVPANGAKPGDGKGKPYLGTEIESVLAQVTNSPSGGPERPASGSDTASKPRSTWP